MRTTHLLIAMMLAIALAAPAHGVASDAREQWMIQTRAADAIGEVLMDASDRAERQVDLLRRELTKAEPKSAAAAAGGAKSIRAPGSGGAQTAYRDLAARVVAEVERTAKDQNDPSLENLSDAQLFGEMAALQSYNLRTFRRIGELRGQAVDFRARLEGIGRWKGEATTQPAIETPEVLAREALAALARPQRSVRWSEARQKMRNAIATARSQQLRSAMPPPASNTPYTPAANASIVDDPRWQPYYYGPGDALSGWSSDVFNDGFNFRGGGGVYERYDTRVNADSDTRTRGQFDRRVNVNTDRRLNVHSDPRENF